MRLVGGYFDRFDKQQAFYFGGDEVLMGWVWHWAIRGAKTRWLSGIEIDTSETSAEMSEKIGDVHTMP